MSCLQMEVLVEEEDMVKCFVLLLRITEEFAFDRLQVLTGLLAPALIQMYTKYWHPYCFFTSEETTLA